MSFIGKILSMLSDKIFMAGANIGHREVELVTDALINGWYEDKYYYVEKFQKDFD